MQKEFRYWRFRVMYSIIFGYACFYLVRQNLSVTTVTLLQDLALSKEELGLVLSTFAIIYGLGKGIAGGISDLANPRYVMPIGLLLAAMANIMVALGGNFQWLFIGWSLNACFQSLGSPSCIKVLTHWFDKHEIATRWAVWNSAQQLGAAVPALAAGVVIAQFGWRAMFLIPAGICILAALILFNRLRDAPESVGLPEVDVYHQIRGRQLKASVATSDAALAEAERQFRVDNQLTFFQLLYQRIFCNRMVWYICWANFFLYIVRFGLLNWAPALLVEHRNNSILQAGMQTALFDFASVAGGVLAGYLSDKVFRDNRGLVSVFFMSALAGVIMLLVYMPHGYWWLDCLLMTLIGFFISGPQILAGVAAVDFASKRVAGTVNGLIGIFGYSGGAFAGMGIAKVTTQLGWNATLACFASAAIVGAFFFALTYRATVQKISSESATEMGT